MKRRKPSKLLKAARQILKEKPELSSECAIEAGFLLALDIIKRMQLQPPTEIASKLEDFATDDAAKHRQSLLEYARKEAHEQRLIAMQDEMEKLTQDFFPGFTFPVGRTKK